MTTTYKIDPAHSTAHFVVKHMMITNVHGAFSNVQGSVVRDPANPEQSKVDVVIDAKTIQTQEPDRDKHLRSADFLDVDKYPTITFKSTSVKSAGEGELSISGDLTIHGVTKPVVLKVEGPTAESKDPWGNLRMGASGTTKIKRSDFGLTWNAALETGGILVGDDVKIELEVSLIKA
ncbi:MAG TPA: YceI family protein [Terriglobia bacterium]|nr:YceI family protein [Terriglobia bacterium]